MNHPVDPSGAPRSSSNDIPDESRRTTMDTPVPAPKKSSRRRRILLIALATIVILGGATALFVRSQLDLGTPVTGVSEVAVQDDQFAPAAIQVPAGTTVTWQWEGEEDHNVVGDTFESPTQTEGIFTQTFDEPGTHAYECTLHLFMRGEVVVTD